MFHIQGRVTERTLLPDGNYLLWLRREQRGLIGHELALLVPPLVFTRDGWPTPGQWVEITVQELGGSAAVGGELIKTLPSGSRPSQGS